MAFTLRIERKGSTDGMYINFRDLLQNCKLSYGHDNDFYILEDGMVERTAILYNPSRIGRGIFFDGRNVDEGIIEISYNIPTTESEIEDFINIAKELERQMEDVRMYCVEEEHEYTLAELMDNKERMVAFSRIRLNEFCANKEYESYIFTLAMWPIVLTDEMVEKFETCTDLHEFEQLLHDKQNMDVYYAKPRILQKQNGEAGAFYVFTEECESIFPIKADGFLNLDQISVGEGFVQYYIFSEDYVMDGLYSYDKFVQYMLENGATYYDKEHILVPSMNKAQMEAMAKVTLA